MSWQIPDEYLHLVESEENLWSSLPPQRADRSRVRKINIQVEPWYGIFELPDLEG